MKIKTEEEEEEEVHEEKEEEEKGRRVGEIKGGGRERRGGEGKGEESGKEKERERNEKKRKKNSRSKRPTQGRDIQTGPVTEGLRKITSRPREFWQRETNVSCRLIRQLVPRPNSKWFFTSIGIQGRSRTSLDGAATLSDQH